MREREIEKESYHQKHGSLHDYQPAYAAATFMHATRGIHGEKGVRGGGGGGENRERKRE